MIDGIAPTGGAPTTTAEAAPEPDVDLDRLVRPSTFQRVLPALSLLSPLLILGLWEVLSITEVLDPRFFPRPTEISVTFWDELVDGSMVSDTRATLTRVLIGFVMGAIPALVLGMALGIWRVPRLILTPIFAALYPVPKIAMFPLLLLVFGLGEMSKYVLIAIVVFFLVFFNTLTGVLHIPPIYFDVAHNSGANHLQVFRTVALPAAVPGILTGMRLAMGTAFVVLAAVEFLGARSGLGYMIWSSWQTYAIDRMYVGLIAISIVGYVCTTCLDLLERRVAPWAPRP